MLRDNRVQTSGISSESSPQVCTPAVLPGWLSRDTGSYTESELFPELLNGIGGNFYSKTKVSNPRF